MTDPHDELDDLKAANAGELHRTVREEGEEELNRPAAALFWSGLAAGIAMASSLIAEAVLRLHLPEAPWRELVLPLGYPVGFLLVILGRMQLFTESTVTATLPLLARPSAWAARRTLRLWTVVLAGNLLGTAVAAAAVATGALGSPELREAMLAVAERVTALDPAQTLVNAVPAGFLIASVAWILPNAREQSFWIILIITYLIGAAGFSHAIVGSVEAFVLLFTGGASAGQAIGGVLAPAVIGNLLGGAGLFALLAHGQVQAEGKDR